MLDQKKARLAWAATGRSAASLEAVVRSGQPADALERLAAAVTEKAPIKEGGASGYAVDASVADAVFAEHCEAMKASVEETPPPAAVETPAPAVPPVEQAVEPVAEPVAEPTPPAPVETPVETPAPAETPAATDTAATVAAAAEPDDLELTE